MPLLSQNCGEAANPLRNQARVFPSDRYILLSSLLHEGIPCRMLITQWEVLIDHLTFYEIKIQFLPIIEIHCCFQSPDRKISHVINVDCSLKRWMYSYRTVQTAELKNNEPDRKIRTRIQAVFSLAAKLVLKVPALLFFFFFLPVAQFTASALVLMGLFWGSAVNWISETILGRFPHNI